MTNTELIIALRVIANWIVAMSYDSEYAHDELKMLHYEDNIRAAADLIEAQAKQIAELEAQLPQKGEWMTSIRWDDYKQPTQTVATNVGTTFMCRSTGKLCPNATEYGYCKQTVCNNSGEWMKGKQESER